MGELARRTNVTVRALRYYEKAGLVTPRRLPNGYRHYEPVAVRQVQEIRELLGLGLSVEETRPFVECLASGHTSGDGELVHLGPAGTGAAAKLIANFALLGTIGLLGEALAVADGLGLPREVTWRVLDRTPLAAQAARRRLAIESAVFAPRFALALAGKDAALVGRGGGR